jgi:hypothetical protein
VDPGLRFHGQPGAGQGGHRRAAESDIAGAGSLIGALANRTNEENQKLYDRMIDTMLNKLGYCKTCAQKTIEYFCTQEDDCGLAYRKNISFILKKNLQYYCKFPEARTYNLDWLIKRLQPPRTGEKKLNLTTIGIVGVSVFVFVVFFVPPMVRVFFEAEFNQIKDFLLAILRFFIWLTAIF